MNVLPKITFNKKRSLPVLIRIDFACCKGNKTKKAMNYFVNEIELVTSDWSPEENLSLDLDSDQRLAVLGQ